MVDISQLKKHFFQITLKKYFFILTFIDPEYRLGYTSSFKYIEDRFGRTLKFILCLIYTFNTIIYAGIGKLIDILKILPSRRILRLRHK